MTLRGRPKRLAGDHALLRRAFIEEQLAEFKTHFGQPLTEPARLEAFTDRLAADQADELGEPYRAWLTAKGIDPATGKMTDDGLAFFEQLVNEQNARNRAKRLHRDHP